MRWSFSSSFARRFTYLPISRWFIIRDGHRQRARDVPEDNLTPSNDPVLRRMVRFDSFSCRKCREDRMAAEEISPSPKLEFRLAERPDMFHVIIRYECSKMRSLIAHALEIEESQISFLTLKTIDGPIVNGPSLPFEGPIFVHVKRDLV